MTMNIDISIDEPEMNATESHATEKHSNGKGRPRKFDIDEALRIALRLFWEHGYEGVSINMLAGEIGINVPSLYAAFGNKAELFDKATNLYIKTFGQLFRDALNLPTAYDVAHTLLEKQADITVIQNIPDGCFMVQSALVTSPNSIEQSKITYDLRQRATDMLTDRFKRAVEEGDLPSNIDPETLALYILAIKHGIAIHSKSGVDIDKMHKLIDMAMGIIPETI